MYMLLLSNGMGSYDSCLGEGAVLVVDILNIEHYIFEKQISYVAVTNCH
jgi:hypothetical protein